MSVRLVLVHALARVPLQLPSSFPRSSTPLALLYPCKQSADVCRPSSPTKAALSRADDPCPVLVVKPEGQPRSCGCLARAVSKTGNNGHHRLISPATPPMWVKPAGMLATPESRLNLNFLLIPVCTNPSLRHATRLGGTSRSQQPPRISAGAEQDVEDLCCI